MRGERLTISKRVRFQIFARDNFTCRYCGAQSDTIKLVVDHVLPVCQGGTNDPENLLTSCEPCNQGKGGKTIPQIVPTEQDRLRLAQERNEQLASFIAAREAQEARAQMDQMLCDWWCDQTGRDSVDRGTFNVVASYAREFGHETVLEWIRIAATKFPYSDQKIGKYISGIRNSVRRQAAETETTEPEQGCQTAG